jgi:hypothetical protein
MAVAGDVWVDGCSYSSCCLRSELGRLIKFSS